MRRLSRRAQQGPPFMEQSSIRVRTLSPIYIPLELKTGSNRSSKEYQEFRQQLQRNFTHNIIPSSLSQSAEYETIESDSWENQLFCWRSTDSTHDITIHVFPNNIGIVVIDHEITDSAASKATTIETHVQNDATAMIQGVYSEFLQSLADITNFSKTGYFKLGSDPVDPLNPEVFWISRTLLFDSEPLKTQQQQLIREWLEHTYRPEDADDIIKGQIDYSMTWLNYVVINPTSNRDERIDAMILAQYYYSAQEHCNKQLKRAIDEAYNSTKNEAAQKRLSRSRVKSRLHQVDYHEHLKYLTRTKRRLLEEILQCWNYDQLTENGQRMIEVCSSKIEETENIKREKSALLTDLLLVALSFFTVFELSLYLTELSREMMSRPTLDFNDDTRSFMLQFIAEIDTDVMFGSGFFLTLLLVFIYKIIKSR